MNDRLGTFNSVSPNRRNIASVTPCVGIPTLCIRGVPVITAPILNRMIVLTDLINRVAVAKSHKTKHFPDTFSFFFCRCAHTLAIPSFEKRPSVSHHVIRNDHLPNVFSHVYLSDNPVKGKRYHVTRNENKYADSSTQSCDSAVNELYMVSSVSKSEREVPWVVGALYVCLSDPPC